MLPSFEVENFRTFSHLQIPHLGGVNLIVGRNNVGKTMLLEAIRIYASGGHPATIVDLLASRDEFLPGGLSDRERADAQLRVASLFHGRSRQFGETGTAVLRATSKAEDAVKLAVGVFQRVRYDQPPTHYHYKPVSPGTHEDEPGTILALEVSVGEKKRALIPFDEILRYEKHRGHLGIPSSDPAFVPASSVDSMTIARQWDAIALHEAEDRVSDCLRIVAPIGRITSVEHPARPGQRMFLARMQKEEEPVPLKSLGDGMVRMFQIALALESARNGKEQAPFLTEQTPTVS